MSFKPNSDWINQTLALTKKPVYFISIDGWPDFISTKPLPSDFSKPHRSLLGTPSAVSQQVERLQGKSTVGKVSFELLDQGDYITNLMSVEKEGSILPTLVNRRVVVFGGYVGQREGLIPPIFTGRISGLVLSPGGTTYVMQLQDYKRALQNPIMINATDEDNLSVIEGNIVNIFYSILTGIFSTTGRFPLITFSGTPTGLGIPRTFIDEDDLVDQRDTWLNNFDMEFEFAREENGRRFIEEELMKLVGYIIVLTDGRISLRASNPPLIQSPEPDTIVENEVIGFPEYKKRFDLHFNRFIIRGDDTTRGFIRASLAGSEAVGSTVLNLKEEANGFQVNHVYRIHSGDRSKSELIEIESFAADIITIKEGLKNSYTIGHAIEAIDFDSILATVDNTQNQDDTEEVVAFEIRSRGLRTRLNGINLSKFIAIRLQRRYVFPPVEITAVTQFRKRNVEVGDVVLFTHSKVPDARRGVRGVVTHPFEVVRSQVGYTKGTVKLQLLDTVPQSKFGVIAPDGIKDHDTAPSFDKQTFAFMADEAKGVMGDGSQPYRII